MTVDIASLGLEIDSTQTVKATEALDRLDASGRRVATTTDALRTTTEKQQSVMARFNADQKLMNDNYARYKAEQDRVIEGTIGMSRETQKLLDRYDPLGTKLRQLQADFQRLNKEVSGGAGAGSEAAIDKTYKALNDEIEKTKKLMDQAGVSTAGAGISMQSLGLNTAFARRELIVLGHEAMNGNFSRIPGSFMTLAGHSNILSVALSPVGLGIAALAAAGTTLAVAFQSGHHEVVEMNNALQITTGYAGLTATGMRDLAKQMSDAGTITIGTAKGIVTQLVASGQIGSQAIGTVAALASDYAAATGKDIEKIAPDLSRLFSDPAKGAEELNRQMHFLSPAELEHIAHLQRMGELGSAQLALAQAFTAHLPNQTDQLGMLEKGWNAVRGAASNAWDAMLGIGRPETVDDKLNAAIKAVQAAQKRVNYSANNQPALDAANAALAAIRGEQITSRVGASYLSTGASGNDEMVKARALVLQTSEYERIRVLTDEIANIRKNAPDDADKARAIFDKQKQIFDIQRGMAAESRSIIEQRIAAELQLMEIQNKGVSDEIETQLKLGNITRTQAVERHLQADLALNEARQIAITQQLGISNLTALEKERLQTELQSLAAQANLRRQQFDNADLVERSRLLALQADEDAKASQATTEMQMKAIAGYDDQIEKLRVQNEMIGQTKEQVDRLKAAEIDRRIASIAFDRQTEINDNPENSPYIQRLDAEIERLKTIKGLLLEGAAAEARYAGMKKLEEDGKRMSHEIERALTDSLMRSFDKGGTFAKAFADGIQSTFKTMILRPIINGIVSPIATPIAAIGQGITGSVMGSLGFGGSGIGQGLSMASNAGSLMGYGTGFGSVAANYGAFAGAGAEAGMASIAASEGLSVAAGAGSMSAGITAGLASIGPAGWAGIAAGAILGGDALFGGGDGGGPFVSGAVTRAVPSGFNTAAYLAANPDVAASSTYAGHPYDHYVEWGQGEGRKLMPDDWATNALNPVVQAQKALDDSFAAMRVTIEQAKDPLAYWTKQTASLGSDLGSSATSVEQWRDQFLKAMDGSLTQDQFTKWQQFGDAIQKATDALASAGTNISQTVYDTLGLSGKISVVLGQARSAVDSQISASQETIRSTQDAADSAQRAADDFRSLAQTLSAASAGVMGGSFAAKGASLQSLFSAAMGGDTKALAGLPQAGQDFLTASLASSRTATEYARDQAKVIRMLDDAANYASLTASQGDIQVQKLDDQLKALNDQVSLLTDVKTLLASPNPDMQAISDQLAALGLNLGAGSPTVNLLSQLVDLTRQQAQVETATAAYQSAKAVSDSLRDQQLAFVLANGGALASGENMAAGIAQQVAFQLNGSESTVLSLGAAYGNAFATANALYHAIPGHATGLDFVPYDNYMMRAHYGEAVLTAPEASAWRSGNGGNNELIVEIRALRSEVAALRSSSTTTATATKATSDLLRRVTQDGDSLQTVVTS